MLAAATFFQINKFFFIHIFWTLLVIFILCLYVVYFIVFPILQNQRLRGFSIKKFINFPRNEIFVI